MIFYYYDDPDGLEEFDVKDASDWGILVPVSSGKLKNGDTIIKVIWGSPDGLEKYNEYFNLENTISVGGKIEDLSPFMRHQLVISSFID